MKLGKFSMDQLDILFQFLKVCELDSPVQLQKALKGWDIDNSKTVDNERPIALRILDHILGSMKDGLLRAAVTLNPRPFNRGRCPLPAGSTDENNCSVTGAIVKAIESQCCIFDRAIGVADAMLYPRESMLELERLTPPLVKFQ